MAHPSVVTLDQDSAPRTVFSGDQLIDIDLPAGSRVIYPKPPLSGLKDVDAAIRYALNHPDGSEPLYAKLRPGMMVRIAVVDISLPLPPMKGPDIRVR
ncbi:MAG: nickel-dependent lactate racemase, partial [Polyangiaceae bacterium]|nr:nickel-dependent lactate racemase [Polyangiaceae bacterium]